MRRKRIEESMIDAQAVVAHLEELGELSAGQGKGSQFLGPDWLEQQLQQLPVETQRDAAGSVWATLRGQSERAVVLGAYLQDEPSDKEIDSRLGAVTGLEVLRALARRFGAALPCTVQLVAWTQPVTEASLPASVAAYLELHVDAGAQLEQGTPLGVGTASGADGVVFHPRLMALCDEAIRELAGNSASVPVTPAHGLAEVVRKGIPAAVMYVQAPSSAGQDAAAVKLHLLQAAESFGRWVESTIHLVAGDEVDLWAREQRVPHSS